VKEVAVVRHRSWVAALAILTMGVAAGACAEDESTSEAVVSLEQAAQDLRDVDILDEGVAGVNGALLNVSRAVDDVAETCDAVSDQADDFNDGIEDLLRALGPAAEGETDAALTVAGVVPQLNAVLDGTDEFLDEVSSEC
jgi:hypothetical protein